MAIAEPANDVLVSAASIWEVATKVRLGKLSFARAEDQDLVRIVEDERFEHLAITSRHAQMAGFLEHEHRDPFDRMLIAQALADHLVLVSNETLFDRFSVPRLW